MAEAAQPLETLAAASGPAPTPCLPLDLAYPIIFQAAALEARGQPSTDLDNNSNDDLFGEEDHTPDTDHLVSILVALPPTSINRDHASSHRTLQRIVLPHLPWLSQLRASQTNNLVVLDWWRDESPMWTPLPTHCIRAAIESDHLPVIQWWWASLPSQTRVSKDRAFAQALDLASQYDRLAILGWVGQFGPQPPAYTDSAIDRAPSVRVLEWWLERNLKDGWERKYTARAFVKASVADNAQEMLDWWLDRAHAVGGWPFCLSDAILHTVSSMGKVAALDWWKNRGSVAGIVFRLHDPNVNEEDPEAVTATTLWYSRVVMDGASGGGQLFVLDWWLHSGLPLAYSDEAIRNAAWHGHDDVLTWWKKANQEHGIELKFDAETTISYASSAGRIHVLDWLLDKSGWPFEYTHDAVDYAAAEGRTPVLDWWWSKRDQLAFRYSESAIDRACQHEWWDVVDWFMENGVEPKFTGTALSMVIQKGEVRVLKMWEAAGWPIKVGMMSWERVLKVKGRLDDAVFCELEAWWKRQGLPM